MMKVRLIVYVGLVTLIAVAIAISTLLMHQVETVGIDPWFGVAALIALTIVGEGLGARISAGGASLSVGLIPTVATVPLFGPAIAIVATGVSQVFVQVLFLKRQSIKAAFNTSQFVVAIGLGSWVYVALRGPIYYSKAIASSGGAFSVLTMLPALAGLIVTYFLVNMVLVGTVLSLDSGKRLPAIWRKLGPVAFANDLASSSFSLFVVFAYLQLGIIGLFIVLLPLIFVQHSYSIQHKLAQQNKEVLEFTIRTIEAKDPYTSGHSIRVAELCRELAEALNLPESKVEEIETAALLHDIGKIDFAYTELIGSPAQLSDHEREIIRSHPERGARLLASLSNMSRGVLAAVRHHHEHYDGNGYPDGVAGHDIPLSARIIMVVDTVDAMLSNRPYRAALSTAQVASELKRFAGKQFDPSVVRRFLELGLLERAARRAEMSRTPLPLAGVRTDKLSSSYSKSFTA